MKEIHLTKGKVAVVDDADYAVVSQFTWYAQKAGRNWYACSATGGATRKNRIIHLHRFLLGFPPHRVDHRDQNGLNNRRENLRCATRTQNLANCRKAFGKSSTYKGVCWDSFANRWKASIGGRPLKHLGRFNWEIEAAHAYDRAAKELWGEFACLNFPEIQPPESEARILIVGHGRSGKDAAALALHGKGKLRAAGSFSWFALPYVAHQTGQVMQDCWETRHQYREFWFKFCNALRTNDPLFLARRALQAGNVVTGLRDRVEMDAAKSSGLFSSILWVERPGIPIDPTVKFTVHDATDVIINDGSLEDFERRVVWWAQQKGYC